MWLKKNTSNGIPSVLDLVLTKPNWGSNGLAQLQKSTCGLVVCDLFGNY